MIKWLKYILVTAAAVILLLFTFLPEAEEKSDGKIHLQYWYVTGTKEQVPYHVIKFNQSQDRIVVEPTALPWNEHEKKILTSILSENPPDVINLVTPVAKWASRRALIPIDSFIKRDNFSGEIFFPALWEEMKWHDNIYALPLYSNSYAFFYNKKLFREAGLDPENPPKTWSELKKYARLLTKKNSKGQFTQMGFIPQYGNLQTSILMAWQLGAELLINEGKQVDLDNEEMVKALQWEADYFNEYPLRDVSAFMAGFGYAEQHGFISEKTAMMVLDNTFIDQIRLYKPDLDYGVAVIPSFEGYETASSSGSWWAAIPRGAKHPEAAWEFLKFAVQQDVQLEESQSQEEILFPANRYAASSKEFINGSEAMQTFVDMMQYAHSPTIVPMAHDIFWREFLGARDRALHKIEEPREALKKAEANIQYQLDQAIEYDEYVRMNMEAVSYK